MSESHRSAPRREERRVERLPHRRHAGPSETPPIGEGACDLSGGPASLVVDAGGSLAGKDASIASSMASRSALGSIIATPSMMVRSGPRGSGLHEESHVHCRAGPAQGQRASGSKSCPATAGCRYGDAMHRYLPVSACHALRRRIPLSTRSAGLASLSPGARARHLLARRRATLGGSCTFGGRSHGGHLRGRTSGMAGFPRLWRVEESRNGDAEALAQHV
jgi:hypothetical protein